MSETSNIGEYLLRLFEEHRTLARHHEDQRGKLTHCILLLAGAALGVEGLGKPSPATSVAIALFVMVLGVFGAVLTKKQSLECEKNVDCAIKYRDKLEKLCSDLELDSRSPLDQVRWQSWFLLHLLVVAMGVLLLALSL